VARSGRGGRRGGGKSYQDLREMNSSEKSEKKLPGGGKKGSGKKKGNKGKQDSSMRKSLHFQRNGPSGETIREKTEAELRSISMPET